MAFLESGIGKGWKRSLRWSSLTVEVLLLIYSDPSLVKQEQSRSESHQCSFKYAFLWYKQR